MSLINDVLKDLERRRAFPDQAVHRPPATPQTEPTRRLSRWPLWLLAAVATGVVLHLSLDSPDTRGRSIQPEPFVAQVEPGPAPASSIKDARTDPPSAPQADRVDTPDGADATSPEREAATASVQSEQSRQPAAVDEPGRDVRASQPAASDADPEAQSETASGRTSEIRPAPEPGPDAQADPASTPDEEPTISIRRSGNDDGDEASDPLAGAKRMLARGQVQRAESRLRPLVRQQPDLTEAHELLARALMQRGRAGQAAQALEAGLAQAAQPEQLAALLGRLLIERGEIARARSILAEYAPPLADAPEHHLLLAAAHRQSGDHEAAAEHYRRLSEALPRRGAVWIGLGASLESLERHSEAASAYHRAVDGDDARAAHFARQRLDALEPLIGESQ